LTSIAPSVVDAGLRDNASKRRAGRPSPIFQDVGLRIDFDLPAQGKFLPGRIVATCAFSSLFRRLPNSIK
jgi:hypothetical protein